MSSFLEDLALVRRLTDEHLKFRLDQLGWHSFAREDSLYVMEGAGKALRPALVLFGFQSIVGELPKYPEFLLDSALAVEMIHSYSLIHDDLPAMDNDDFRRGKATLHKKHNDARAILSGDALLTGAFEILSQSSASAEKRAQAVFVLAQAAGARGMIAGQMRDIFESGQSLTMEENLKQLSRVHTEKTGALIAASVELGMLAAGAPENLRAAAREWSLKLGLLFQVVDDVLDATQTSEILGKSAGKDQHAQKRTYVSLLGLKKAQDYCEQLNAELREKKNLFPFCEKAEDLVNFVNDRKH